MDILLTQIYILCILERKKTTSMETSITSFVVFLHYYHIQN